MSVVGSAQLRPKSGDGEFEAGKYVVRQVYLVVTNSLADDGTVVVTAPGLPPLFTSYPGIPAMRARRFTPKRILDKVWEVEVEWSTPERKEGGSGGDDKPGGTGQEKDGQFTDPTQELPTVKFDVASREVLITQVVDSVTGALKPPTSSNGEAYDPPPKRLKNFATMEITRNEPIIGIHPALGIQYVNAVSSDVFWGMDAGVWQCKKIAADIQVRQLPGGITFPYLKVTYSFEATDTWDILLLDYGTTFLGQDPAAATGSPAIRRQFRTREGHPTAGPLNGSGGALIQNIVCTLATGTNLVTIMPPPSSPFTVANNQLVQFTTIGGTLPASITAGTAYWVINTGGTTFQLSLTRAGLTPIVFAASSTPTCYVSQPAVYNTIRAYPWLPFSDLNLPNSFAEVQ